MVINGVYDNVSADKLFTDGNKPHTGSENRLPTPINSILTLINCLPTPINHLLVPKIAYQC